MANLAKRVKRAVKRVTMPWRKALIERTPEWARQRFGLPASYLDMLLVDHGIFRLVYLNRHRVGKHAWRSAQPAPHQIAALARQGLRTIVNLRGQRSCGSYWLEKAACDRHGIRLVDFQVRSRAAPSRAEVRAARELFEQLEYPILLHCKSGADRAGLMSVLYRHIREGDSLEDAKRELSLRYGHIRQADTGILDLFFERYLEHAKKSNGQAMPFFDWVDTVYDPEELKRSFHAASWANRLVNGVLRRE